MFESSKTKTVDLLALAKDGDQRMNKRGMLPLDYELIKSYSHAEKGKGTLQDARCFLRGVVADLYEDPN